MRDGKWPRRTAVRGARMRAERAQGQKESAGARMSRIGVRVRSEASEGGGWCVLMRNSHAKLEIKGQYHAPPTPVYAVRQVGFESVGPPQRLHPGRHGPACLGGFRADL